MQITRVGVDLAKNVYQLHGVDRHGQTVWKRLEARSMAAGAIGQSRAGLRNWHGGVHRPLITGPASFSLEVTRYG